MTLSNVYEKKAFKQLTIVSPKTKLRDMTRMDPIIAVKDLEASAKWYQQIFGFKHAHGGDSFAVLKSEKEEIVLCLHKWGEHGHPTLTDQNISAGNGLLLYFKTDNMEEIRRNVDYFGAKLEKKVHQNQSSLRKGFSLKDLDGYYLTVTAFHQYEG